MRAQKKKKIENWREIQILSFWYDFVYRTNLHGFFVVEKNFQTFTYIPTYSYVIRKNQQRKIQFLRFHDFEFFIAPVEGHIDIAATPTHILLKIKADLFFDMGIGSPYKFFISAQSRSSAATNVSLSCKKWTDLCFN